MMQRRLLAAALVLALSASATEAKADVLGDVMKAFFIVVATTVVVGGTAEVLTAAATYKNTRAASQHQEPSAGWIGVGAVGGLLNVGVGGYLIADSLPSTYSGPCDAGRDPPYLKPAPGQAGQCLHHTPASAGGLIFGTLFLGFGAFALGSAGWAIKNAPDKTTNTAPGSVPAAVGLSLPLVRF